MAVMGVRDHDRVHLLDLGLTERKAPLFLVGPEPGEEQWQPGGAREEAIGHDGVGPIGKENRACSEKSGTSTAS